MTCITDRRKRRTSKKSDKKEKNDKGNYKIRQQGARAKMGPLLDRIPALGHTLSVGDLITPNGIDSMRTLDSNLFSLVKQRYGTATPKIAQAFSPYNGDVADLNYGFMQAPRSTRPRQRVRLLKKESKSLQLSR